MDNVTILPYCEVDGIRTVPDSQLINIYEQLISEGVFKRVFYDGSIQSEKDFLRCFKSSAVFLYLVYVNKEFMGAIWLTTLDQRIAQVHFFTTKRCIKMKIDVDLGKYVLHFLLHQKHKTGYYLFDTFYGIVPTSNTLANRYIKKLGCIKVGEIPNFCTLFWKNKIDGATLYYITRGNDENI